MPKSPAPPIIPEVKFERVLRIARFNSTCVIICAGLGLLFSATSENWVFAAFSGLALVSGAMERHGQMQLQTGEPEGLQWLTGAQLCLYTVVVGYVLWRWKFFDAALFWSEIPAPSQEQMLAKMREAGLDPVADRDPLLQMMNTMVGTIMIAASTLHQVGLTLWYRSQREAIAAVLGNPSTRRDSED